MKEIEDSSTISEVFPHFINSMKEIFERNGEPWTDLVERTFEIGWYSGAESFVAISQEISRIPTTSEGVDATRKLLNDIRTNCDRMEGK